MRLSEEDVTLFYKLYPALLVYVNAEQGILSQISTTDELMSQPVEERVRVRDQLYENIALIDSFANDNPFGFTSEELEIVRSWKHFIRDRFYLFRYLKKYSIFLSSGSPPKAYGVLSISDRLKDLFPYVPVLVETVLLPFKGQIVYDGYVGAFRISFGGGIRRSFKEAYDEAKATYGIISTLPFETVRKEQTDEAKLKYYLKSERNREYYREETQDLIHKNRNLMVLYHQEMGKSYARTYGKRLREIGLSDAWFGILEGLIVASGKTKENLQSTVETIVPSQKEEFVYFFRLKSKRKR